MKCLWIFILSVSTVSAFAERLELMLYSYPSSIEEYELERTKCINNAYDLETKAMDKTDDTNVKVRKSRLEFHPLGLISCFVKFFGTEKITFKKVKQTFRMKRCNDKNNEIAELEMVVWTDFYNRVKLRDGTKGCVVHSVQGVKI